MEKTNEKTAKVSFSEILVNFIQRNRKVLAVSTISVLALLVVISISVSIVDSNRVKAIAKAEEFIVRYSETVGMEDEAKKTEAIKTISTELEAFAASNRGYPSARAYMTLAAVYSDQNDWAGAEKAWNSAAAALPKSYMAPVALYNAATAAEESGNYENAILLYKKCVDDFGKTFPLAARAYLAIGRIYEERADYVAATDAYKKIVELWPFDNWTKLANSRILSLASKK